MSLLVNKNHEGCVDLLNFFENLIVLSTYIYSFLLYAGIDTPLNVLHDLLEYIPNIHTVGSTGKLIIIPSNSFMPSL